MNNKSFLLKTNTKIFCSCFIITSLFSIKKELRLLLKRVPRYPEVTHCSFEATTFSQETVQAKLQQMRRDILQFDGVIKKKQDELAAPGYRWTESQFRKKRNFLNFLKEQNVLLEHKYSCLFTHWRLYFNAFAEHE